MRKIIKYTSIFLLLLPLFIKAEVNPQLFLKQFNNSNLKAKLELVASVPFAEIKSIYPQIKDTLLRMKKLILEQPTRKEIKFLFDKVEADIELNNENYTKAIFILETSLRFHSSTIQDSLQCYSLLKNAFVKIRDLNKALEIHQIMKKNWDRKGATVNIEFGNSTSTLYNMIGLTDQAIKERWLEGKKTILKNDISGYANLYNDIGVFYNSKKKSDSAEFYFLKAKKLLLNEEVTPNNETAHNFFIALIDGNIALSFYNRGNIKDALPLLKTDVYYSLKVNNYESAFNSYNLLAKCYIHLKQSKLAKKYIDTAQTLLSEKIKGISPKLKLILTQANYYGVIGDYKNSNLYYTKYLNINDSFQLLEKERQLKNQSLSISIEQSERELLEKDKLLELNKYEEAKQKTFRAYLVAGIIILLSIILFLILNNHNSKKRELQLFEKNKQITSQKELIEQSLKEKEALIKEIHHRVKNNLQIVSSILRLQIDKVDNKTVETILNDAQQRINAISLTHQMLYQKSSISTTINLDDYVEQLVRQIEKTVYSSNIELVTFIQSRKVKINIDTAVPLGLIINEILTNAYKHAFTGNEKGTVFVNLTTLNSHFTLKISDTGKGLSTHLIDINQKSMGMELIHILAEQLEAKLTIDSLNGTAFTLEIKL